MEMICLKLEILMILSVRVRPKIPDIYFFAEIKQKIAMTLHFKVLTLNFFMKLLTVLPDQIQLLVSEIYITKMCVAVKNAKIV